MGYTIVSGNTPSSVALYQNHGIVFIEILKSNAKYLFKSSYGKNQLSETVLKIPQLTISLKLIAEHFEYALI